METNEHTIDTVTSVMSDFMQKARLQAEISMVASGPKLRDFLQRRCNGIVYFSV